MRISFLHTMASSVAVFGHEAEQAGCPAERMRHTVREDLRQAMAHPPGAGGDAHTLIHQTLQSLAAEADAIIVTCATLGPAIDTLKSSTVPIIRADAALAEAASRAGNNIAVICAVESTVAPNQALFGRYAATTGARVTVKLIPGAWALYQEGNYAECMAACAQAARDAHAQGFDVVAYAHPWMAGASALVGEECRPMHGAQAALRAVGAHSSF